MPKSLDPKTSGPEDCVPCLFLPYSSARFLVFYLHSNAEDIGRCHAFCSSVRAQFQVHVLAVEYPGYGICPGGPCDEERVTENAFVAFRFVREVLCWPLDSILILGRSIGCGPAISLAVRYQVSGVIVVSPMLSVKEVCKDAIGPLSYMVEERFPNKDRVPLIRSPFLVVHGQKDMMIPCRHGVELYGVCRSRKLLICPKDMEHNTNLLANVTYFVLPMLQFFSLPDYCFEDIIVPSWAYDKRLSPLYNKQSSGQQPMYGLRREQTSETDHCETPQRPTMGCLAVPVIRGMSLEPAQDASLDETSTGSSFNRWLFGGKAVMTSSNGGKKQQRIPIVSAKNSGFNGSTNGVSRSGGAIGASGPRASAAIDKPGTKKASEAMAGIKPSIPRVVPPPGAAFSDPVPSPAGPLTGGHFHAPHPQPQPSPQRPLTPPPSTSDQSPGSQEASWRVLADTVALEGVEDRTASRNRFQEFCVMPTPPWGPSDVPSEPKPCEGIAAPPPPPTPPKPPSPSSSLKLLTPVDLVEIVEDLERHFANENAPNTDEKAEVVPKPRPPPASAPCTPASNWRVLPGESPHIHPRSGSERTPLMPTAPPMPLMSSLEPRMGQFERSV